MLEAFGYPLIVSKCAHFFAVVLPRYTNACTVDHRRFGGRIYSNLEKLAM